MIYLDELGHLMTDGEPEELHKFAAKIGMRRTWYQCSGRSVKHPHYDCTSETIRLRAVHAGAVKVGSKDVVKMFEERFGK